MKFQLGAMSVGDILDRGQKLLLSRLGTFYTIYLIILSPLILFQVLVPFMMLGAKSMVLPAVTGLGAIFLLLILSPIGTAAILRIISEEYVDRRVSLGEAFRFALSRFGALLGASILAGLLVFLGFLLFIIPGILWGLSYAMVGQVVVVEGLDGMAALNRSAALAKGYRGRIFGIMFLVGLAGAIMGGIVGYGLQLALPLGGQLIKTPTGFDVTPINHVNQTIHIVVTQLVNIFFNTYSAVCLTLVYFDLRVRKEGFDLELAASQNSDPAEPV